VSEQVRNAPISMYVNFVLIITNNNNNA
jgi:hypothetical protein